MTAAIGAAACVIATACGIGFGQTWVATMSNLPRAYPDKYKPLVLALYAVGMLAGAAFTGVCLGLV